MITEQGLRTESGLPDVGLRAWLYDVAGDDAPISVRDINPADLSDEQILWVDVDLQAAGDLGPLWSALGIQNEVRTLETEVQRPHFTAHEHFVQLNVLAARESETDFVPVVLHCLVGTNWIATLHEGELDLVDGFNEPLANDTRLGELDAPAFLSMVLDWHLSGYLRTIEQVQGAIDQVDEQLLKPQANEPEMLERLFELRRRVTRLRSALSPHRDVLGSLSNPHSDLLSSAGATADFRRLLERLESALDEVNTAREMIAGSFDIYMTQISQNTNEIMKRLTLASVLLLPAVLLAGIMGMNFKVGLFDVPWMFWTTILTMALLAACTLVFARRRKWL